MAKREHLRLLGDKQLSEIDRVKFNYGHSIEDENIPQKEYDYMGDSFKRNLISLEGDISRKRKERDVNITANIDYIRITFYEQFNINEYYNLWYTHFGFEGVSFHNYAQEVLFAVTDINKLTKFINKIKDFIAFSKGLKEKQEISNLLFYVESFKLLKTSDIINFSAEEIGDVVIIRTIDLPLNYPLENSILETLEIYLKNNEISYSINREDDKIELFNPTFNQLVTISSNFDIIESISCSMSSVVRPSSFNVTKRDYGFTINNSDEELPLIGIIDTGISMETPLRAITLQDDSFSIDGNPLIDVAGRNGHGTAVASLAALGRENHLNNFNGIVNADAKLLSIKLSDSGGGYFSENEIIDMLYASKRKYPKMRLFVLTMLYNKHLKENESFSTYTYALDKFAHETDSLIFISTGNNNACIIENSKYDLSYFNAKHTNLFIPADSMNNVVVGAAAENLNNDIFNGISHGREFPALFTRKSHINLSEIYPVNKSNKNLFKPDVLACGGDIGYYSKTEIDWVDNSAMQVLSANPEFGYYKETGTSFSAPLAANLAAKILKLHPSLNSQTVKALIINNASLDNIKFPEEHIKLRNRVAGYGIINIDKSLYSNENSVTIILEDFITNEEQKIYPINFPEYLIKDDLRKKNGILKVTATLSFSFIPIQHNHLSYCPIHIAFSFFKNHSSSEINKKKDEINSLLRSNLSWSQSGRYKSKPIPYTNSQRISFNVDVKQLINESRVFKLAVQSRLSSQLLQSETENYPTNHPFSIVINIEETTKQKYHTGKLYDEIKLINNLEIITTIEVEGTLDI